MTTYVVLFLNTSIIVCRHSFIQAFRVPTVLRTVSKAPMGAVFHLCAHQFRVKKQVQYNTKEVGHVPSPKNCAICKYVHEYPQGFYGVVKLESIGFII